MSSKRSVFEKYQPKAYPHTYEGTLTVDMLCGGVPSDPKKAEGWIRSKLAASDDIIRQLVAEAMVERDVDAEEATNIVVKDQHVNGFKRTSTGELYIEGRQLKAAIKEAANVRWPTPHYWYPSGLRKGQPGKGEPKQGRGKTSPSFFAEHVFVLEDRLLLGVTEPAGVNQRFVHAFRNSIAYEEYVTDVEIDFTVTTDFDFKAEEWAMLWLTGEQQGIGATRSMGYGRYTVTRWEKQK
jgi:hypothetical protein